MLPPRRQLAHDPPPDSPFGLQLQQARPVTDRLARIFAKPDQQQIMQGGDVIGIRPKHPQITTSRLVGMIIHIISVARISQ